MADPEKARAQLLSSIDFCAELVRKGSHPETGEIYARTARELAEAYRALGTDPAPSSTQPSTRG